MSGKRILYLNGHQLTAYAWAPAGLVLEGEFDASPDGLAAFAAYLQTAGAVPCYLLCNVAEEAHQIETIPFLRGGDRQTLLARRCGQAFFGTPLTAVRSLGYEKDRRRNERVLLAALTAPAQIQPWLNAVATAAAPLAGIYTVSQLGGTLLRALVKPPARCLLITLQDQGIRESYLVDGIPVFSRIAPSYDASEAGLAATLAAEAPKLQQSLIAQRLISRNEVLPVCIVAPGAAVRAISVACRGTATLQYEVVDCATAAQRIGLKTVPNNGQGEVLFAFLLGKAPPREQFAPAESRRDFGIYRLKQGLIAAGALAVMAAVLFAGKQLAETYSDRGDIADLARLELDQRQRYQQITATFPQLGLDNDALRAAADRYRVLQRLPAGPGGFYQTLGSAMDVSPAIELDALEWSLGLPKAAASGTPSSPPGPGSLPPSAGESLVVRGRVSLGRESDARSILAAFDAFVSTLRALPGLQVSIRQQPFDLDSGRSLRGGSREEEGAKPKSFVIVLLRGPQP